MTTDTRFKSRYRRKPIPELGEPCPHSRSSIDCEPCVDEARASLPPLADTRCHEHLADSMRVVKSRCGHSTTTGCFGRALVCETCGCAGHQWTGYVCGRRRPTAAEIELEQRACPIWDRLAEQKQQTVPA